MGEHSSSGRWLDVLGDPTRREIVAALVETIEAPATELVSHSNASEPTVRRHLTALVELGVVRRRWEAGEGTTPGRPPAMFGLRAEVRETARAALELLDRPIGCVPR